MTRQSSITGLPACIVNEDSEACELAVEAYIVGYIKALIQAVDSKLGWAQPQCKLPHTTSFFYDKGGIFV